MGRGKWGRLPEGVTAPTTALTLTASIVTIQRMELLCQLASLEIEKATFLGRNKFTIVSSLWHLQRITLIYKRCLSSTPKDDPSFDDANAAHSSWTLRQGEEV